MRDIRIVIVALMLCLAFAWQCQAQSQWTQFGHQRGWYVDVPWNIERNEGLAILWQLDLGQPAYSQPVVDAERVYLVSGRETRDESGVTINTSLAAYSLTDGEPAWQNSTTDLRTEDRQEAFGGTKRAPMATPCLAGSRIVWIGFGGQISCNETETGERVWQKHLTDDLGGEPVQFGFSASPVFLVEMPDRVFVVAGGAEGGVYCLSLDDGSEIWKSESQTFSYATPAFAEFGGVEQFVIYNRDRVFGIAVSDGRRLWAHELAEAGLTNVPTPLVLDGSRLVISGQGVKGTRCLNISAESGDWIVEELWFEPQIQFFYTNWLYEKKSDLLLGCTDKLLVAVDASMGQRRGRYRGFGDGNMVALTNGYLVVDGRGTLHFLEGVGADSEATDGTPMMGLNEVQKYKVADGRVWTAPACAADSVFVRLENQLIRLGSADASVAGGIDNQIAEPRMFEFEPVDDDGGQN